jgi:hypothetical protein
VPACWLRGATTRPSGRRSSAYQGCKTPHMARRPRRAWDQDLPQPDLRRRLEPLIRSRGLRASARRVGIGHYKLVNWLKHGRCLKLDEMARLAGSFGLRLELVDDRQAAAAPRTIKAPWR